MKFLVTGLGGFVGRSVAEDLLARGHQVVGLDRAAVEDWAGEQTPGDMLQMDLVSLLSRTQPDVVVHAAGSASVAASMTDPEADRRASLDTFAALLDAARTQKQLPHVIFPSSAAVYGNPAQLPVAETAPLQPISPYGFHKVMCETLAREYWQLYGLPTTCLRIFSLFGVRQQRLLVWEIFQQAKAQASEVTLQGTGRETRDYLAVEDLAAVVHSVAQLPPSGFHVLNAASGEETSVERLARIILDAVGSKATVRALGKARPGDPTRWQADVHALLALLGAEHRVAPIAESLGRCVQQWMET